MNNYKSNVLKIYIFSFFYMYLIIVPVIVPYFMSLGLTMAEVLFIQAIFGFSMAIFEVPSAYLGDLWGRKKILLLGTLISGSSFTLLLFANNFWSLLFYEVLLAIGASFVSGADLAIMYDSIGNNRVEKLKAISNFHGLQLVGESVAAVSCSILMFYSYKHVIWGQVIVAWIPFLIVFTLKEPKIEKMNKGEHKENFKEVIGHIFKNDKIMRLIFINMVTWSIATFSAVWLIQKYWENQNIELYHIGLLWAVCNLSAALTGKIAPKLEEYFGSQKVLAMIGILPIVAYITMGLFPGLVGVAGALMFYFSRGLNMVIMKEGFNHRIPDKFRNTANSLISLCFRMTFFILGPIIGFVIDNKGMNYTLIALGLLFTLCFIGLMVPLILKLNKKQES